MSALKLSRNLCRAAGFNGNARNFSSVSFNAFGNPKEVLSIGNTVPAQPVGDGDVKVSIEHSPITFEDLRSIRGVSFLRNSHGVGGVFGVGKVASVGSRVKSVAANGNVFVVSSKGTWNDEVTTPASSVFPIPALKPEQSTSIPSVAAAYAMLHNYVQLRSGDVVLRSATASPINSAIDQICKKRGITVMPVSVADAKSEAFAGKVKAAGAAKLLIAHETGKELHALMRLLSKNATVITHNEQVQTIEEEPSVGLPTAHMIFDNLSVIGFDLAAWALNRRTDAAAAITEAAELLKTGAVSVPVKAFAMKDVAGAVAAAEKGEAVGFAISK